VNQLTSVEKGLPLRYFFQVIFKRKRMILIIFFTIVFTVTVGNLLMKHVYESSAKILLELKEESEKALLFRMNLTPDYSRHNWINSEVQILNSRPVIIRVIKELKLLEEHLKKKKLSGDSLILEEAIDDFYKALKIETTKDAPVVEIKFQHQEPQMAARIVQSIIKNYIQYRNEIFEKNSVYRFLNEQIQLTEQQLKELEEKAVAFKQESGLAIPQEHGKILYDKLANYEKNLAEVQTKRIALESQLKVLRNQLAKEVDLTLPAETGEQPSARIKYILGLRTRLFELELQRQKLLEKYTPQFSEIVNLNREIETFQKKINDEMKKYVLEVETEYQAIRAEEKVLNEKLEEIRREIQDFVEKQHQLEQITRGIDDKRDVYSVLLKQKEEARISLAKSEERVSVKVISPPTIPVTPVRPKRKLNILISIFVGLIVSLGTAFLMEMISPTFSTVEEVEKVLNIPVLGSIHEFSAHGEDSSRVKSAN